MSDLSIHPRNWPNGSGKKKNTSQTPKDRNKGILGKRLKSLESRRQAYDVTIASSKTGATAFKRPGSMTK